MAALLAAAAEPLVGSVRGQCLACHVTPGGEFRYPVLSFEQYTALRWMILLPALSLFIYGLLLYVDRWTRGGQRIVVDRVRERLARLLRYGLLQAKVLRRGTPGGGWLVHLLIYSGAVLLLVAGLLYAYDARATRFPDGWVYTAFRVLVNVGGLLLFAGSLAAIIRRLLGLTPGMPTGLEDYVVDLWLAAVAFTGALLDAGTAVAHNPAGVPAWDLAGRLFEPLISGMTVPGFLEFYRAVQVVHLLLTAGLLAYLPFTKLSHIVVSGVLNTFFSRLEEPAALPVEEDAEERIERGETIGIVRLSDTSWKQRMDYDACTGCARCHNACPAAISGKPLSPMKLVRDLKKAMDRGLWDKQLVPEVIDPRAVWSCVTCGACVNECPVLIHHVETIVGLRRSLISQGENVPEELLQVSYNLMRTGNPYGADPYEKEKWVRSLIEKGLAVEAREGEEYDYLLWVGCAPAFDPRLRGTVEAVLRLAKRAGIRVAVIPEQGCCGDPARRIGDELMFLELAKQNIEMLRRYRFRKLLVTCPHGFNVFRNEYPKLGLRVEVEHHSQLLARLLREGKLKPGRKLDLVATFHDPCYLGRWNRVYEPPREVLRAAVRELREMPRNRDRSFCCGGGGGGVFYDPKIGSRISRLRAEEAKSTGARVVAVACPFCNIMLSAEAPDLGLEVKDIAELLDEAVEGSSGERRG